MPTITLGREGNQPFSIQQSGVSRRHAEVAIDPHGNWSIRDLGSANGTFVRDNETGDFAQINGTPFGISPVTYVRLGPDNANGCGFYAGLANMAFPNLPATIPMQQEFSFIQRKWNEYKNTVGKAEMVNKWMKYGRLVFQIILVGIFYHNIQALRIAPIALTLLLMLSDRSSKIKKAQNRFQKFCKCPNPQCSRILTETEIRNMQCSSCRNIIRP